MSESKEKDGRRRVIRWVVILAAVVFLSIAVIYIAVAIFYQAHFYPGTVINRVPCGSLDLESANTLLVNERYQYELPIWGLNRDGEEELLGILSRSDVDLRVQDYWQELQQILQDQNGFLWVRILFQKNFAYDIPTVETIDEEKLAQVLDSWEVFQKENQSAPENARIGEYSTKLRRYEIVPEKIGNTPKMDRIRRLAGEAFLAHEEQLRLQDYDCYSKPRITSEDETLKKRLETVNRWLSTEITYDWHGTQKILDADTIQPWISFLRGKPLLDEEAVSEYVKQTAKETDTYGKNRWFTTTLGVELQLPSAYGWKTDRAAETEALLALIYEGSVTDREPVYSVTAAASGEDDIGDSYVEADLSNQHLYLYVDGEIVLETDFVSGNMSNGNYTPAGIYGLTYKTKNAILRGDNYATPVNYWMPFNGNVGMHDATWRKEFGGDIFLTNGSHGCINLPLSMAKEIYQYVSKGFPVICYYY